jgi:hypothetical protein
MDYRLAGSLHTLAYDAENAFHPPVRYHVKTGFTPIRGSLVSEGVVFVLFPALQDCRDDYSIYTIIGFKSEEILWGVG